MGPYQTFGGTTLNMVPNQLAKLQPDILEVLLPHFSALCDQLVEGYRTWQRQRQHVAAGGESEDAVPR